MIFGGLSEQEVEKIEELLKEYDIPYETGIDQEMLKKNKQNINSLDRSYFRAGDPISGHVLCISIAEKTFINMSDPLKKSLLEFGITNDLPDEADFFSPEDSRPATNSTSGGAWLGIFLILAFSIFLFNLLK